MQPMALPPSNHGRGSKLYAPWSKPQMAILGNIRAKVINPKLTIGPARVESSCRPGLIGETSILAPRAETEICTSVPPKRRTAK